MALQGIVGRGPYLPDFGLGPLAPDIGLGFTGASIASANASAKIAFLGRVWNKDHATKNLSKIHWLFGTLTKTNAFTVQVSVQGGSTSAGPPGRPDGTILASGNAKTTFLSTDANVTSNTWFTSAALTSAPSVTFGQLISVVWEWTSAGTTNTVTINGIAIQFSGSQLPAAVTTTDGTTWNLTTTWPNVLLEFDDGTFGTLDGAYAISAQALAAFSSATNPNERAMLFQVPFPTKIDGCWFILGSDSATMAATIALKDSSGSVLNSCSTTVDGHYFISASGSSRLLAVPLPETTLAANTDYYLSVAPTSGGANSIDVQTIDVNAAGHWNVMPGGQNFRYATRNGAAWTEITTRRLVGGVRFSALDDGAGGGGGGGIAKLVGQGGGLVG